MPDFLRSHQVSAAIVDLIEGTKQQCYLVTPWVRPWAALERALEKASARDTRVTFILRNDPEKRHREIATRLNENLGFEVLLLDNLHTKFYMNERLALVGSMNLYDVSQSKNLELVAVVTSEHEIRRLRREVIEEDLLAVQPTAHLHGRFHDARSRERTRLAELAEELAARGFCVTCGERMELEKSMEPYVVRCRTSYAQAPNIPDPRSYQTKSCHYCGSPHPSVLARPLHPNCKDRLREYLELSRQ